MTTTAMTTDDAPLYALSVMQPWAFLILAGVKPVENRTWRPPAKMLGRRFALHASAGFDSWGWVDAQEILAGLHLEHPRAVPTARNVPRGAILGTARLVGAVELGGRGASGLRDISDHVGALGELERERAARSPWAFGPWSWLLEDVRSLREPIPARGALGFWKVPGDIAARVREGEIPASPSDVRAPV